MTHTKPLTILQLYPRDMNIYGDTGNLLALTRRIEQYGLTSHVIDYNQGDLFPDTIDIIIGGGGQDSGQTKIHDDLIAHGDTLIRLAEQGVPMLMICGLYQLFGHAFITKDGVTIPGIGLLDIETIGTDERLIGNVITESTEFGSIVGYENHSGQTQLGPDVTPLASVRLGAGNNSRDGHEGARIHNVIGSYLHGSLLPKNPAITDFLIRHALENRGQTLPHVSIDDSLVQQARAVAMSRPR